MNNEIESKKRGIIEVFFKNHIIQDECIRIGGKNDLTDDLISEITIILLEYDSEKIVSMNEHGKLLNFIRRVISNTCNSKTSRFYYSYKKNKSIELNDERNDYDSLL